MPPSPSGVISNTVSGPMMPGWMVNLSTVDLGEHGVQVHDRAVVRDVERQDGVDRGGLILEDVVGNLVDGVGLGALGNADGQRMLVDVQDVAALDVEGAVTARSTVGTCLRSQDDA